MRAILNAQALEQAWADLFGENVPREFVPYQNDKPLGVFKDTQSGRAINIDWLEEIFDMENK